MSRYYLVQIELAGNPYPLDVCRCMTVESLAAILGALGRAADPPAVVIRSRDDTVPTVPIDPADVAHLLRLYERSVPPGDGASDEERAAIERLRASLPPF